MKMKLWIAWILVVAMLLGGCVTKEPASTTTTTQTHTQTITGTVTQPTESSSPEEPPQQDPPQKDWGEYVEADPWDAPKFEDMEYTRPDTAAIAVTLDACSELVDGTDSEALWQALEGYLVAYSDFVTNYWLSYIRYNLDLSDEYWQEEYDFCNEYLAQFEADVDILMHALADSTHRDYLEQQEEIGEGFFDSYEGDSIWTDRFTELMEQENELQAEYYALSEENANVETMAELLVDMILLRQQIAEEAGYEDYPSFAYDYYYQRDYTVAQAEDYLADIRQELVPLYQTPLEDDSWMDAIRSANSQKTLNYVEQVAQAMGGTVEEAYRLLTEKELYHIRYGYNKLDGSFCAFLPDYMTPFVFVSPTSTTYDYLSMTHEFGHFSRAHAVGGASVSIDVEEIFSHGLENLSLCYGGEDMAAFRMVISLSTYVEQSAYADFELRIYDLEPENVTVEALRQAYDDVKEAYELGSDALSFTDILHLYVAPMYVISYVTSNDAALQLYQMELAESGSGATCYNEMLDSETVTFLAFLEEAGLESPFAEGRIQDVRETLAKMFE